jgi:ribonuclease J
MWHGYKDQPGSTKDFLDFIAGRGMPIKHIHTSGHADLDGLKRMVNAVKPKNLVPIHTFEGEKYKEFFPETLFPGMKVKIVNDGEMVEV